MIFFPPAKINIGLHIIRKRSDGYHDLETCMVPIPLYDALEWARSDEVSLKVFGRRGNVDGPVRLTELEEEGNLILKAYFLLTKDYPIPVLSFYLFKNIPFGAGLGGGSSDGVLTLVHLNRNFNLGLNQEQIYQYSLQLGSDCPFFIDAQTSLVSGKGEILEPIPLDLSPYTLIVVKPPFSISTGEAYTGVKPSLWPDSLRESLMSPIDEWRNSIQNDFETSVFGKHPVLAEIKQELYRHGALFASLSGSGSALFGIFKNSMPLKNLERENRVFYIKL